MSIKINPNDIKLTVYDFQLSTVDIVLYIIIILCVIIILFNIFLFYKSNKVAKFRKDILKMCSQWSKNQIKSGNKNWKWSYDQFNKIAPYHKMVYSFKPLKLKYWLVEEFIKELKKENNQNNNIATKIKQEKNLH